MYLIDLQLNTRLILLLLSEIVKGNKEKNNALSRTVKKVLLGFVLSVFSSPLELII